MTGHTPRTPRAVPQRQALGRRLRAHRMANGLTIKQVAAHLRTGKEQMQAVEHAVADLYLGTAIDIAELYGLNVALVADCHLPLLNLTADETAALIAAADLWTGHPMTDDAPHLRSALDKLTTTEEPTDD